jgi:hypothetical protein
MQVASVHRHVESKIVVFIMKDFGKKRDADLQSRFLRWGRFGVLLKLFPL